jgi:hypothetical protein
MGSEYFYFYFYFYFYKCNVCDECVSIQTEKATEDSESVVITSAVLGTLATGSSSAYLVERLSILDIPPLSGRHFLTLKEDSAL